jgi:hypothetical protein
MIRVMATRKLYKINETIKLLPLVYVSNKNLDDYVNDMTKIIVKKDSCYNVVAIYNRKMFNISYSQYYFVYNPRVYQSLTDNYNMIKNHNVLDNKNDMKLLTMSHRIVDYLMTMEMVDNDVYKDY